MRTFPLLIALSCGWNVAASDLTNSDGPGPSSVPSPAAAEQIMAAVLAGFPQKDFLCQARLTFPGNDGQEQRVDVQLQTHRPPGAIGTVIVVTGPTNLAGHAVLSLLRDDGTHELHRKIGSERTLLRGEQLAESFAGTDFAYEDFDFRFLRWPSHKLLGEKRRQAQDCYVIESVPAPGQSAQYSRVVSWIAKDNLMLLLAEGYGADGHLLKLFDIRALRRFEGGWFIKTMNLKNMGAGRTTRLEVSQFEYATNLEERYFAPETFGRVAAFKFPHGTKPF